jgi:alkyldihydroxyacetonephosphate synthase
VGTIHAPYLEREVGRTGIAALSALARELDPRGVLNPGVLLPAEAS